MARDFGLGVLIGILSVEIGSAYECTFLTLLLAFPIAELLKRLPYH